jgi:hypothetical protein
MGRHFEVSDNGSILIRSFPRKRKSRSCLFELCKLGPRYPGPHENRRREIFLAALLHPAIFVGARRGDERKELTLRQFPNGFSFSSRAFASFATLRSNSCSRGTFFSTKLKYLPLQKSCISRIESTSGRPSSAM